jgi:HAE1 family hydrophobic/amphiphilic exporter-1
MLKIFIEKPVLSTVLSIIIVILGLVSLIILPVEQYPYIAPPTVQIEAQYPGANAEAVMNSVVIPIEEQVNGVEGMTYMTSTAANDGSANITVFFRQDINPDIAAVNVQNLVSRANSILPQEVTQVGITVKKQQSGNILLIAVESANPDYDDQFVANYVNINLLPQIKRVYGVGSAIVYGPKDYSMRIWLKPDKMSSYSLNPSEIIAALQDQNIEAAPGELGQNSLQTFQYTIKYSGKYKTVEEFENIIIRHENSQILKLKDIAKIDLGVINYDVFSKINGNPGIILGIGQTAGSNAQEVIDNVKDVINKTSNNFPNGMKVSYLLDINSFLSASIHKVVMTLLEAFVVVFLVVFVFLQNFRSTIIPAITVPVAIIGTFFFLQIFGFSINLLTLFALVLAIGIVVDDAIVVVEAVHSKFDSGIMDSKEATLAAMKEIAPAIISITLVMSFVFIPVSFLRGPTGIFFRQFGLTLAFSIIISAINALTLSPALCAVFLTNEHDKKSKESFINRFFSNFNLLFNAGIIKYRSSLYFLGKKGNRWITLSIIAISSILLVYLMNITPKGFVPQEDSSGIFGFIMLPPGASLERTDSIVNEVINIAKEVEYVDNVAYISGYNLMIGTNSSYATVLIRMKEWGERKTTMSDFIALMTKKTAHIKDASFMFSGQPTLQGFGANPGVELKLQDKMGGDINKFFEITNSFLAEMNKKDEVFLAMTTFNPYFPQKQVKANISKIKEAGITLTDVMQTLQAYVGSMYISNFNLYGKQFRIMVQASPEYRSKIDDLDKIYIRTKKGNMAPITEFLSITDKTGAQSLTRFNMYSSISIVLVPNIYKGYSTGDVINTVSEVTKETLPDDYSYEYSGMTREETNSGNQTYYIFGLSLIFVYLLLAALYESYILPFAVIISLPIGLVGVFIFILFAQIGGYSISNNIYVQISIIMLIGLLSKNAILIIEYAIQRRKSGSSIVESAVNGAVARLRPILMTSFAFILGLFPLVFSFGVGQIANRSIGVSAVGGMLLGTVIGIIVIPSLFIVFQMLHEKINNSAK